MKSLRCISLNMALMMIAVGVLFQSSVSAQIALDKDQATRGSKPYEEAVRRYLDKEKPKIIGGKPAPIGQYPWQVSLGVSWIATPFDAHFCGGSVYSERWIITASHCVNDLTPAQIIITAGTNRLIPGVTRRNVRRIIMNKNYNASTTDNDIALIELLDPLPLSAFIKTVSLLTPTLESELNDGSRFVVTGWGAIQEGGDVVRDLRYVDNLPMIGMSTCNQPLFYDGKITENMICVGTTGKDSCQGDSGGPLTVDTETSPKLAGIVSWGEGCARPNRPGIYTRVAKYTSWIESCVAGVSACM